MKVWALWADTRGEEDKRKRARLNGKKGRTKNKRAAPPPAGGKRPRAAVQKGGGEAERGRDGVAWVE